MEKREASEEPRGGSADVTDNPAAFLRDFGTEEPRKGTLEGPLSACDAEAALAALASAVMVATALGPCPSDVDEERGSADVLIRAC